MSEITQKNQNEVGQTTVKRVISQAISQYTEMIENKAFDLPENYSYKNAIQQTRYLLTKPAESGKNQGKAIVDFCTPQSILQSVMEMAQKGLNPDKKQCYFIPYGNTCTLSVSYQGNVALAKRNGEDIGEIYGYAVYKNDEFELEFNIKKGVFEIKKYVPKVTEWKKSDIVGAFAIITDKKGEVKYTEYMTMEQIKAAWAMGAAKGNSPAHRNFPDQQAIKTVKSRAVKSFVNTADDSEIVNNESQSIAYTDKSFNNELENKANKLELEANNFEEIPEIESKSQQIPENVDEDTGEIIEEPIEGQSDFFGEEFEALEKAPF